ncbi:MAG: hypothetical protein Q8P81_03330 [Nanoarchaeota archaeon]|nr:hypothetical protein [Nanoarchaeota archaeon]
MLTKVLEVVDNRKNYTSSCKEGNDECYFSLKETFINSNYIIKAEKNDVMIANLEKGFFNEFLKAHSTSLFRPKEFTTLTLSEGGVGKMVMVVSGNPHQFSHSSFTKVLHG